MTPPPIRLHKAIARAGACSLREAERLIQAGQVRVNGEVVERPGVAVTVGRDAVELRGRPVDLRAPAALEVWALYKPKRCITSLHDPRGRPTVKDFFPRGPARLVPVGRLDYDAEGLLLLTNDGQLAHRLAHPAHAVPKTYLVKVKGLVSPGTLGALHAGPELEGRRRAPVRARVLHNLTDKTWLEVTLREGINHHIKKMFAAAGHRVLKIKRYSVGTVELEAMQPGDCRKLSPQEVARLLEPEPARRRRPA